MKSGFWHYFVLIAALAIYICSLCPTTYADFDSIEFAASVAANTLPHPSGYPLYHILGRVTTSLLPFKTAYSLNLISAVFGALTVFVMSLVLNRLIRHPFLAASSAFLLGTTPTFWKLSIVSEVYTLHTFLIILFVYLLIRWKTDEKPVHFILASVVLSLSVLNHMTTVFLFIPAVVYLLLNRTIPHGKIIMISAFIGLFILTSGYLVYMPHVAVSGNHGMWKVFLCPDGNAPSITAVYNYVSGTITRNELWKSSYLGRGFYYMAKTMEKELTPLPFVALSDTQSSTALKWLSHLFSSSLLLAALVGAYFNLRGEGPSFSFFALFMISLVIFYCGFGVKIQDIASMYLPVYMFMIVWMCCAAKGLFLVLRDYNSSILTATLYMVIFLTLWARVSTSYPYCDLSNYQQTTLAARQLKEKLPVHSTYVGDYLSSMLISLEHSENEVFSDVEVIPYGMTNTAFKKLYESGNFDLQEMWDDRLKIAFAMHRENVFTNLLNQRFLSRYMAERIPTDTSIDLFRLKKPRAPEYLRISELPFGVTIHNQRIGDYTIYASSSSPQIDKYGQGSISFRCFWRKLPLPPKEEPIQESEKDTTNADKARNEESVNIPVINQNRIRLMVIRAETATAVPIADNGTAPSIEIIPGKGWDLSSWDDSTCLSEERRVFLPSQSSQLVDGNSYHIILITGKTEMVRICSFVYTSSQEKDQ